MLGNTLKRSLWAGVCITLAGCGAMHGHAPREEAQGPLRVVSDTRLPGPWVFPESVGCDIGERVLYVSQFGGQKLQPAEKDGLGYISKVSPDGRILEERAFAEKLDKPKGIWIRGNRLWVTDIDSVWIFDTKSKRGRKLDLPGIKFANDPAVRANVLYVSDNRSDQLFRVEPADFLDARVQPKVTVAWSGKGINPNGLWPGRDGSLFIVGFLSAEQSRGIHTMGNDGDVKTLVQPIGRLDGLYQMRDGSLLVTDWNAGSLFRWSERGGMEVLAKDFKGPADFCVMGDTVYVPDLVQSQVRAIRLSR